MVYAAKLQKRIDYHKRRYRKTLRDVVQLMQLEIECLGDADFTPSTALESQLLQAVQTGQRLHALNEAHNLLKNEATSIH